MMTTTTRLFGTEREDLSSEAPETEARRGGDKEEEEGEIYLINNSSTPPPPGCHPLSLPDLERTVSDLRHIVGYPNYDVTLVLTDDDEMRTINLETRDVDGPTDVLSFPFQECKVDETNGRIMPGRLMEPEFDLPDYYTLGDIMVDVPYVHRRIEEDRRDNEGEYSDVAVSNRDDDEDDRGVSAAMSEVYDPQRRIEMLLVHGMLHLVGYDHIKDDDYELMVQREEDALRELEEMRTRRRRRGEGA